MNDFRDPVTPQKTVLLVGGGHAHALVLHALGTQPIKGARVIVINPGATAPYSGMLPGFVAGHYTRQDLDIDLVKLAKTSGAEVLDAYAVGMDAAAKTVVLQDGTQVPYDVVSFDVGITSNMAQLKGFEAFATPAKPLAEFATTWDAFRRGSAPKEVAILGGGIAGAELAMAMAFALKTDKATARVKIIDRSTILSFNSPKARVRIRKELARNGVEVIENADVTEIRADGVVVGADTLVPAQLVIGTAGATPHPWVNDLGLDMHEGFIKVDTHLRASDEAVFAVGDCAHMTFDPRPKAGVYAVRQAPILLENLRRAVSGDTLESYRPQNDYLKLVSLGGKRALAEKLGVVFAGRLMWMLKDRIDRTFMNQF